MRSENIVEEGVNGLCLFTKLSVPLRAQSSLQVRENGRLEGRKALTSLFTELLMENIDLIVFLFILPLWFFLPFRYFIYGMQDAQNLERVKLEFSIFDIPKGEHKPKSE